MLQTCIHHRKVKDTQSVAIDNTHFFCQLKKCSDLRVIISSCLHLISCMQAVWRRERSRVL